MKVQLESTDKIVHVSDADGNELPARLWEGTTENGIVVHAFITRIAVHKNDDASQFERELQEHRAPSAALNIYPPRIVL